MTRRIDKLLDELECSAQDVAWNLDEDTREYDK